MLDLGGCTLVSDAGLEHLKSLTLLQWIWLGGTSKGSEGTKVTKAGVAELKKHLPMCQIITFDR